MFKAILSFKKYQYSDSRIGRKFWKSLLCKIFSNVKEYCESIIVHKCQQYIVQLMQLRAGTYFCTLIRVASYFYFLTKTSPKRVDTLIKFGFVLCIQIRQSQANTGAGEGKNGILCRRGKEHNPPYWIPHIRLDIIKNQTRQVSWNKHLPLEANVVQNMI